GLRYLDAVRRLQPEEPFWTASTAAIMLALGDTAFVDSALARVLRSGESREALLLSGLVALRRGQDTRARALLGRALIAGADTAETVAALAFQDARARRWAWAPVGAAGTGFTSCARWPQCAWVAAMSRRSSSWCWSNLESSRGTHPPGSSGAAAGRRARRQSARPARF